MTGAEDEVANASGVITDWLLPLVFLFVDQDFVSAQLYRVVAVIFSTVAVGFSWAWLARPQKFDRIGRMMLGIVLVAAAEFLLTQFFSASRDMGRPDSMYHSWWPILFRTIMLAGAALHLSGYKWWQIGGLAVAGAGMVWAYDTFLHWLYP